MYVDPIFQARMPDPYYSPLNYGASGVFPEAAGWNVNSAYLSPSFLAGYRPNYQGPQNFQMPYMGFWRGMNTALPTPLQPDTPYYVDPRQYREHGMTSGSNKAMDLAMTGAQLAVGIGVSSFIGNLASRNPTLTTATMGQMLRGENILGRVGAGLGRGFGVLAGAGTTMAGRGLGLIPFIGAPLRSGAMAIAPHMMGAGAAIGGAVGGLVAPFAIGVGAAEMLDRAVFRPYLAGRQSADVIRAQLTGQVTGLGTSHSPLTPSNAEASRIGFAVSSAFGGRLDFNDMSAPQLMQFGMQEGLYRNMSKLNAGTITARTKELAEQVKIVMDVFNEPSMQDAIKELGRMAFTGGVTGTAGVSSLLSKYKLASALTGVSTRELAGTVGMQGQLMYQQAGLVPALGQASALASLTGINAAFRSGLIGADTMAMLGGQNGMVQGTQQGLLGLSQSTYNRVMAYNQMFLGGAKGDIVGNLNKMGAFIASDPLSAYGKFAMNANKAVSAQLRDDPFAPIQGSLQLLDRLPGAKDAQGRYKSEVLFLALTAQGLDPQQAESLLRTLQGYGAPDYMKRLQEANYANSISEREKFLEQEGLLYYNSVIGNAYYGVRRGFAGLSQYAGESWGQFATNVGGLQDAASGALFGISGAAPATDGYGINAEQSYEDFVGKRTTRRVGGRRRVVTEGSNGVLWSLGAGTFSVGALATGSGFLAAPGIVLMGLGGIAMGAGSLGYNPVKEERLKKLYDAADSDPELAKALEAAKYGTMSASQRSYLMAKSGETTESGFSDLVSSVKDATVLDTAGKTFTGSDYEAAQEEFKKKMNDLFIGTAQGASIVSNPGAEITGINSWDIIRKTGRIFERKGDSPLSSTWSAGSDKLGMEASSSLGKIITEMLAGSYDPSGNRVAPGKGDVPASDDALKMRLSAILEKDTTFSSILRSAGLDPSRDINQIFSIGRGALVASPAAVMAADVTPGKGGFDKRYQRTLAAVQASGAPTFNASGELNATTESLAANVEKVRSQAENAIAGKKATGLSNTVDFSAMISTLDETAKINKGAAELFYRGVGKLQFKSDETIDKEILSVTSSST